MFGIFLVDEVLNEIQRRTKVEYVGKRIIYSGQPLCEGRSSETWVLGTDMLVEY